MIVERVSLVKNYMVSWAETINMFPDLLESEPEQFKRICDPRTVVLQQEIKPRYTSWFNFFKEGKRAPCYDPYNIAINVQYCTTPTNSNCIWTAIQIATNEHAINTYLKRLKRNGRFGWPFISTLVATGAMGSIYMYLRNMEMLRTMSSDEVIRYVNSPDMQLFESLIAYSSARTMVMKMLDVDTATPEDQLSEEDLQYLHAIEFIENLHLMDMASYRQDSIAAAVAYKRWDELYEHIAADGEQYFADTKTKYICKH